MKKWWVNWTLSNSNNTLLYFGSGDEAKLVKTSSVSTYISHSITYQYFWKKECGTIAIAMLTWDWYKSRVASRGHPVCSWFLSLQVNPFLAILVNPLITTDVYNWLFFISTELPSYYMYRHSQKINIHELPGNCILQIL